MLDFSKNILLYNILLAIVLISFFHLLFLKIFKLNKIQWKIMDYIWLFTASLGLLFSIAKYQQDLIKAYLPYEIGSIDVRIRDVKRTIDNGQSAITCRKFTQSELSPPMEELIKLNKIYSDQCEWFKSHSDYYHDKLSNKEKIDVNDIIEFYDLSVKDYEVFNEFIQEVRSYNSTLSNIKDLNNESKPGEYSFVFMLYGSFLLTFALSIRITKVTCEIVLEKKINSA